jgi:DHA1 family bicyclomycin/chloramphenicol resistance-like MFS transporter
MNLPFLMITLTSLGLLCSDIHVSVQPVIKSYFQATTSEVQALMTFFFGGTVAAALISGAISDLYGRRPCVLFATVLMVLSNAVLSFADNLTLMMVARFFQGAAAGAISVLCYTVIQDCSSLPITKQKNIANLGIVLVFIPSLSPILGGSIAEIFGWRAVFYVTSFLSLFALILTFFTLKETNFDKVKSIRISALLSSAKIVITNRQFNDHVLIYPVLLIGYWIFITSSSFEITNQYKSSLSEYKYLLFIVVVMFALGNFFVKYLIKHYLATVVIIAGVVICLIGSLILLLGNPFGSLYIYVLGNMAFSFGLGLIFSPLTYLTMSAVPDHRGISATIRSVLNMLASLVGAGIAQIAYLNDVTINIIMVIITLLALGLIKLSSRPRLFPEK